MEQAEIILKGIVQGVGFRPFVKRIAVSREICGFVENREFGVRIIAVNTKTKIEKFYRALLDEKPDVSVIIAHRIKFSEGITFTKNTFTIAPSKKHGEISALLPPDIATCETCLEEITNPEDRHYKYPFTNCTNCGPRFSIIRQLPYDRKNTTMDVFEMCPACNEEYTTLSDRRFHAQPNACPNCGPHLSLYQIENGNRKLLSQKEESLNQTIKFLKRGKIVAIKGLGGFHIACDATNTRVLQELRKLKHRPQKPFALMADKISTIKKYCSVSAQEEKMLTGQQKPIVLLKRRSKSSLPQIAPEISHLGFMLPYTPLHYLLLRELHLLVMTSGNIANAALEKDNQAAFENLSQYTKYFLTYNRKIHNRVDDSIVKFCKNGMLILRKARGFTPFPIKLKNVGKRHKHSPESIPQEKEILAVGADMKGSFGLLKNSIFLGSQYMGDLQFASNLKFYEETLAYFQNTFDQKPKIVLADEHPNYYSTQLAEKYATNKKIPLKLIQHHRAHIYSVMAEHDLEQTIGVSFDGSGLGDDGQIWGGEFFVMDKGDAKRVAHLKYQPMVSADMVAKEPWRMALIYLYDACPESIDEFIPTEKYPRKKMLMQVLQNTMTSLKNSSMGRLFDAVSSLLGICNYNTYQGEAAMKLESISNGKVDKSYSWETIRDSEIVQFDASAMIREIVKDIKNGIPTKDIATKFHLTIAEIIYELCEQIQSEHGCKNISLSGGVFQNVTLVDMIVKKFKNSKLNQYFNQKVPPNDAGIALGQIYGYLL